MEHLPLEWARRFLVTNHTGSAECKWSLLSNLSQMLAAKIAPLDQVGWLSRESAALREWVTEVGRWRVYDAGQLIYGAGDLSDGIYGLGSGSLEIMFPLIGDEPVFMHLAEIGFWIGDTAELAGVPRIVSLGAASRCRLLHLPSRSIQTLLNENPEHWRAFYRLSAINIGATAQHYSEALSLTVRARVCRLLLRLTDAPQVLEVTQDGLARLTGVTRGTMRRCLSELSGLGAIDIRYRKLRVLNAKILSHYCNEQ